MIVPIGPAFTFRTSDDSGGWGVQNPSVYPGTKIDKAIVAFCVLSIVIWIVGG